MNGEKHIKQALQCFANRTKERVKRGVYGQAKD